MPVRVRLPSEVDSMKRMLLLLVMLATVLAASDITANDRAAGAQVWVTDMLYHGAYPVTYPATLQPGDVGVWLDIEMTNYYTMDYYNISAWLEVAGPFEGVVTATEIANAKPMERVHAFYQLNVKDDAKPGEYVMRHHITYYYDVYDKNGDKETIQVDRIRTVSANVYYSEKIEIKDVTIAPVEVVPGDDFKILVRLENTGSVTVNDIDVSYEISTDPTAINLMPLGMTVQRVASIKPGESVVVEFPLRALKTATVKAYKVGVGATYTSGSTTSTESDVVAVDVIGRPAMRLAGVQVDKDIIYTDQAFSLSVQLENIGTGDAKSVKVALRDGGMKGVLTSYIGTVEVDDTGSAIFDVLDSEAGSKKATALLAYEDSYGNLYTDSVEVEYFITQKATDYVTPVIAVVVLAAIGFWYWRGQSKKKRIAQLVK